MTTEHIVYLCTILTISIGLAAQYFQHRRFDASIHSMCINIKPVEVAHFVEFRFMNSKLSQLCQVSQSVAEQVTHELAQNNPNYLIFDTLMNRRCIVNPKYVVSASLYKDKKIDKGLSLSGILLMIFGQDGFIETIGNTGMIIDQLERQSPFLEIGNQMINAEHFMLAIFDLPNTKWPALGSD